MKRILSLTLLPVAFVLFACGSEAPEAGPGGAAPGTGEPPSPMGGGSAPDFSAAGLAYDLPPGWNRVPPESPMRMDQATIPGEGGSAEMAVFFFGPGSGGGVQENLDRWAAQVRSSAPPAQESFETGGMRVTWMDVSGTLLPSSMGMGPATEQPNSRMFAAVVEGDGGPWFFKITGPAPTLAGERDAFVAMLRSVRRAGTGV
ncbi:MAG TPA: hypothetical protein VMS56_05340 [Thermoanaerobaculia bacterium]|nr:hypothetical protein [Thermoanaerobaculia bacterium]